MSNADPAKNTSEEKIRVAVIGGGIAGVAAAEALRARGYEVMVFEERFHLGGKLGAHPARVPLDRIEYRDLRKVMRAVLRKDGVSPGKIKELLNPPAVKTANFRATEKPRERKRLGEIARSRKEREKLIQDLKSPTESLPYWMRAILINHFSDRRQCLGLDAHENDFVGSFEFPKRKSMHTTPREDLIWTQDITFKSGKVERSFSVSIAMRERFDGLYGLEFTDNCYHEHCYHMYLNWYQNFWALVERMGISRSKHFTSYSDVVHLSPGREFIARRAHRLRNPASASEGARNLLSGAGTTSDLTLWMYSMADLVSHRFDPTNYLDRQSVHAFLSSRWYSTEGSSRFHEHLLAKAFAVPTYFSSAYTYRKYVEYSLAEPSPMLWVLNENSYDGLFKKLEEKLGVAQGAYGKVKFVKGARVTAFWRQSSTEKGAKGPPTMLLRMKPADLRGFPRNSFSGVRDRGDDGEWTGRQSTYNPDTFSYFQPHYVVLAVPPLALTQMSVVDDAANPKAERKLTDALSSLGSVRKLKSGVTAVLDLHFFEKVPGIPKEHCVLLDSDLGLTFFDNSQLWPRVGQSDGDGKDQPSAPSTAVPGAEQSDRDVKKKPTEKPTALSVAVTDFYKIDGLDKDEAIALILEDLERFIPIDRELIDFSKTYLQKNDLEPLFINEVGSEVWRPGAVTDDPQIFLAGDYCDTPIGVVSVEAAVVSGLLAVRAIQAAVRRDWELSANDPRLRAVEVLMPKTLPLANLEAYKTMFFGDAMNAHTRALHEAMARHPEQAISPADIQREVDKLGAMPAAAASTAMGLGIEFLRWVGDAHSRARR